jgi:nicotinamidase-related amidase
MAKALSLSARYIQASEERFETLTLPIPRTVLLLVDVYYDGQQRGDWGDPSDPFVRRFEQMERNASTALDAARSVGLPVVYAMNSAPRIALQRSAFGAHFARAWSKDGSPEAFNCEFAEGGIDPREYHGGPETPLKVPPSLAPRKGDFYIRKHVYSAFFDSRLDTLLRNLGIETLVCAGLWANVCMAATALDALYRNYRVIWLRDGTLAGERSQDIATLANTARWIAWFEEIVGYTVTSTEFAMACEGITHGTGPKGKEN